MEDDLINTQFDLHYELLLMSVPRWWGGGERGFRWYSDGGMLVEIDRSGVLTYGKKTINVRIVHSQICLRI